MYELDDVIYYGDCIVNASYSLCGFNHGKSIAISGYRHKYYKDIKCPKCREIYKWVRSNGFKDYNWFMKDFDRYYQAELYHRNDNLYNDIVNNKFDLNTGINSYNKKTQEIINKIFINNDDIEYLKKSKEVVNIDVQECMRFYWKYIEVKFELLYGDKFTKQTKTIYVGVKN